MSFVGQLQPFFLNQISLGTFRQALKIIRRSVANQSKISRLPLENQEKSLSVISLISKRFRKPPIDRNAPGNQSLTAGNLLKS